jgi:hypothetical protein
MLLAFVFEPFPALKRDGGGWRRGIAVLRVFKVKRRSNDRRTAARLVWPSDCVLRLPNHSGDNPLKIIASIPLVYCYGEYR